MRGLNTILSLCIRMFCCGCSRPNSLVGTIVRSVLSRPPTPVVNGDESSPRWVRDHNLRSVRHVSYAENESEDDMAGNVLTSNIINTKVYSVNYIPEENLE